MKNLDSFDQLLAEFGTAIGITDLTFDADGLCHLCIDASRPITFRKDEERHCLVMIGMIAETLPENLDASVLRSMLASSLIALRQREGILSLDESSGMVVMHLSLSLSGLSLASMQEVFGRFIVDQIEWMRKLGAYQEKV
ncbi:CesT family type III secretion system chaperone [Cupriavidus pampae]|uniref:CesT family type III secretion system chaperone n=1 Tax=Cupriavidus pampae TaxID=659251 RepID=UPI001CC6C291|nr:CesT family type III secretion system chaperone [Cupriavidus pampae]